MDQKLKNSKNKFDEIQIRNGEKLKNWKNLRKNGKTKNVTFPRIYISVITFPRIFISDFFLLVIDRARLFGTLEYSS